MARATGLPLDIPLARATGAFRQSVMLLLNDEKSMELDDESINGLMEFEQELEKFEKLMLKKRHDLFLRKRVVMFDGSDFVR